MSLIRLPASRWRNVYGGTAFEAVKIQVEEAQNLLDDQR